jgi:hypothetical protein
VGGTTATVAVTAAATALATVRAPPWQKLGRWFVFAGDTVASAVGWGAAATSSFVI